MTGFHSTSRRSFGWALTGSVVAHAAALAWGTLEFAPPPAPVPPTAIEVKLAAAQKESAFEEKQAVEPQKLPRTAKPQPQPQPQRPILQTAARNGPVPERAAPQPFTAQSPVETEAPRAAAPTQEAPVQLAIVPEPRARERDYVARYLHNPPPPYPWQARRMGVEGRVVLHVEILQSGDAGRIEIRHSSGHEMLDQAAINAVSGWRFAPARVSGAPITAWADVPISFKLTDR